MAPLIVITGPTASGKTGLALSLAERYQGEIVCADSRTIYAGMDIGTAKPTAKEQSRVPHHGLDAARPGERYTAADFQVDAYRAINSIRNRNHTPFLVGGTGLYIDAVVREYEWPSTAHSDEERRVLEGCTTSELQTMIKKQQLPLPVNQQNRRHLINTLLRSGKQGISLDVPRESTIVVAIATEMSILELRIRERAHAMFKQGVVEEAQRLASQFGWESEAMSGNIYPLIRQVIDGKMTEAQAIEKFVIKDRQLAKRQVSWLKRHKYVRWLTLDEAEHYLEQILSSGYASIEQE